ncbi:MAG: crtI, partial [Frankiales bacterium]|nr:crtI [Frankiales bacterium]
MTDAIVIGSGPNGLVGANVLADHGWDVLVLEAQQTYGGAVKSAEVTAPGFVSDLFSSFYPLGIGSPVLADLQLEQHGLRWRHAPSVLAHPLHDGRTAVLSRDLDVTSASVAAFDARDGEAWRALAQQWSALQPDVVNTLMGPFPPARSAFRLARELGAADLLRFARFATLSVRRFSEETFHGEGAGLLLAGNAMHTDLAPEAPASAVFGWLLAMLGQDVGFPVPEGGAGNLAAALVRRLLAAGGRLECDAPVTRVVVRDGRVTGVRLQDGTFEPSRVVLADVSAPALYLELLEDVPARLRADLEHFEWDDGTVKVDWALSG